MILWKDGRILCNLDINIDLDVDEWNKRMVQSSICSMIILVCIDLYIWMSGYILQRQTRN